MLAFSPRVGTMGAGGEGTKLAHLGGRQAEWSGPCSLAQELMQASDTMGALTRPRL